MPRAAAVSHAGPAQRNAPQRCAVGVDSDYTPGEQLSALQGFNLIDLCIAAVLCVGFTLGVWKGFLRSLLGVLGLVAGAYFAVRYYGLAQPYLGRVSSLDPLISTILSIVLIFIGVQVVFLIVRRIMKALVDLTKLGWVDRTFGAVLGLAAGFCVAAAGVQALLAGVPELPLLRESRLIEPVNRLATRGMGVIPSETKARLDAIAAKFKQFYDASPSSSPVKGSGSPKELFPGAGSGPSKDRATTRGGGSGGS